MRGKYDIIYLITNSAIFDVTWDPLKRNVYEVLGRDQRKKEEEWYWSTWSDQRLMDLMEDQRKHIQAQRRNKETRMRYVLFIIDDYADSPELHRVDGPLASLLSRGRHLFLLGCYFLTKAFENQYARKAKLQQWVLLGTCLAERVGLASR